MSAAAITREIAEAGVGVGRLIRYDPRWPDGFNPTTSGFLRSFLGPLLGLPFSLLIATLSIGDAAPLDRLLWASGLSYVMNALAFPALIAALARPLKIGEGYAGFIIIVNWATLFLNACTAGVSLLILGGETGRGIFTVVWLVLFGLSLFIVWRASRETLSTEIPIALLMVVLSVGVGALTDQVFSSAFGISSLG